jgi:prepilin-type N-terminal cleavage/methylation domain-containing protein
MKNIPAFSGHKPRTLFTHPLGFTLVELLIVIAIIAILAGLAFPAVQGALQSGKKAQARNDVHQLAAAIKAFQLEYGRLPGTGTSDGPAPGDLMTTLTSSNSQNPRGIVFFEPKIAKQGKGGLDGTVYKDPWGNPYTITLDYNYDNKVSNSFTTVIVSSPGPDLANSNGVISTLK